MYNIYIYIYIYNLMYGSSVFGFHMYMWLLAKRQGMETPCDNLVTIVPSGLVPPVASNLVTETPRFSNSSNVEQSSTH